MPHRDHELVLGFDADDTLWHSEDGFDATHKAFVATIRRVAPHHSEADIVEVLDTTERANMALLGYGVKAYTISMIEATAMLVGEALTARLLSEVVSLGKHLLEQPVVLLDGVAETIAALARHHHLVLITKGDLLHQERKVAESGLEHHFAAVEVVSDKHPGAYERVLRRHGIEAARFVMVGNSVKSDILPVLAIGARAVHIPYEFTWSHEVADHGGAAPELASITELPAYLSSLP